VPSLAFAVAAIAVPDSLNPSLIIACVFLALGPRPLLRTVAFTVATFAVTLAGGAVVALGLGDLILSLLPKLSRSVKYEVMAGFGGALICGGAVIWWRRSSLAESEPPSKRKSAGAGGSGADGAKPDGSGAAGSAALLGAGIAGVELFTAFPYFAAIALVVGASAPTSGKIVLLVLYNVIYVLPLILIVIVCAVMGDRAGQLLAPVGDWIAMRWPVVVAPLVTAAGAGVMGYAIAQLA